MDDKCQNCAYVSDLRRDVEELKTDVKDIDKRLSVVEIDAGKREEKIDHLGDLLLEIKGDVKEIKGSKQKFISGIIGGVAITVIAALVIQALKIFHW